MVKRSLCLVFYLISHVVSQVNFESVNEGGSGLASLLNEPIPLLRSSLPIHGSSCTTPLGEPGICSYIEEPLCAAILNRIQTQRLNRRIIAYIQAAVKSPCGFDVTDYTMCCKSDGSVTSPPPISVPPPPVSSSECGISQVGKRIVGGTEASAGAWPWAAILGQLEATSFRVICGGTLISPTIIVTAAHCFPGGSNSRISMVRLGEHDVTSSSDGASPLDVPIASIKVHEGFNVQELQNDIAIVKMSQPVTFTVAINPACLPNSLVNFDYSKGLNTNPSIIGWGSTTFGGGTTNIIRQAVVPVIDPTVCLNNYANVKQIKITDKQVCAGELGRDSCTGDSGGPLLTTQTGFWTLIGVTSFGVQCARAEFPGVYTRVDKYLDWIASNS